MTTTVYGVSGSPFVRKVLLCLEHKGVPYELDPVVPMNPGPDFAKKSPLGKIPAFSNEEISLADSSVICQYLEERHPEPPILPGDRIARARARFLEEYADTRLAEVCGQKLFFERVLKPRFFQQPTDEAVVADNLANGLPRALDYLESQAPGTDFLLGDRIGLADLSVGAQLVNAMYAGYRPDAARWPGISAWFGRFLALPLVANRLAAEKAAMPGLVD